MTKRTRRYLQRVGVVGGLVPALVAGVSPVQANVPTFKRSVTGVCHYQVGTVEGAAVAVLPNADQTGIVCNVYENGVHIGGCGGSLPGSTAACVGPAVGIGAPYICTYAWARYGGTLVEDRHCE